MRRLIGTWGAIDESMLSPEEKLRALEAFVGGDLSLTWALFREKVLGATGDLVTMGDTGQIKINLINTALAETAWETYRAGITGSTGDLGGMGAAGKASVGDISTALDTSRAGAWAGYKGGMKNVGNEFNNLGIYGPFNLKAIDGQVIKGTIPAVDQLKGAVSSLGSIFASVFSQASSAASSLQSQLAALKAEIASAAAARAVAPADLTFPAD